MPTKEQLFDRFEKKEDLFTADETEIFHVENRWWQGDVKVLKATIQPHGLKLRGNNYQWVYDRKYFKIVQADSTTQHSINIYKYDHYSLVVATSKPLWKSWVKGDEEIKSWDTAALPKIKEENAEQ